MKNETYAVRRNRIRLSSASFAALTVTHSLCDERTRTHEVYRCTVHSRHQDRAARTRSCWPRGAVPCAACPVCVSASSRSRSTVRESGSENRCHGSDGVLPSGRDRREAGGGAAAAADAPAAQSCRAPERWHTARRRRRPPRWLSLLSRRRFASRRRQLLRRESSEATYAPPLCGSSKERTRWHSWAGRGRASKVFSFHAQRELFSR